MECVAGARRYVVAWCKERGTTETLRSLRSSMLSWGRGGSGGKAERARAAALAAAAAPAASFASAAPTQDDSDDETHDEAVSLLPGSNAVVRRRYAVKVKRKSKITFRLIRSVHITT